MASSTTLDFDKLLAPIAGDNPSGEPLRYAGPYDAIQEARRADDANLNQGEWKRDLKAANWLEIDKRATEALGKKSKDLQIAAWLTEAMVKQQGFAGIRDGLRLLRELHERFWDTVYPLPENGDLEFRAGALDWLNDKVSPSLRAIGLTKADSGTEAYSWFKWQESRSVDELGRKNPQAKAAAVAEGKITGEQFDKAVAVTSQEFYETLKEDLSQGYEECERLATVVDQKYGRDAPSLMAIKKSLEDCRTLVEDIFKRKNAPASASVKAPPMVTAPLAAPSAAQPLAAASAQETPLKPVPQVAPARPQVPSNQTPGSPQGAAIANNAQTAQPVPTKPVPAVQPTTNGPAPTAALAGQSISAAAVGLEPRDRADAVRRLRAIVAFLRRTEPASPVPYLLERAARWTEMPLEQWLTDVISDKAVLAHVRETLGLKNTP
jgi:type VI secretion system protein ImpA